MIKIFGKIGASEQIKGHNITAPSDDWVEMGEDRPEGNFIASASGAWVQPTLHEQAMSMSMSKMDFVDIAEALTANMPNPVTWAGIRAWMTEHPEIDRLFTLATDVYRNDPKLDEVTAMFGQEFLPFLDMMFVYQNEIKAEIASAKAAGRAINLDALIAGG